MNPDSNFCLLIATLLGSPMVSWIRIQIHWMRIWIRIQQKRGRFRFRWIRIGGTWIWIRIQDVWIRTSLMQIS